MKPENQKEFTVDVAMAVAMRFTITAETLAEAKYEAQRLAKEKAVPLAPFKPRITDVRKVG